MAPTTMTLTIGATGTITATVSPDNASNKKVNWSSSNEAAATVANGVVTAKAVGTATITATSAANNSKKANCVITVEAAPEAPVALDAVNNAASADAMKTAIENNAEVLGLSIGEGTDYAKLIPGRDRSVSVDLVHEGNRGSGYTVDSLKSTFDAIVATRLATQASMDHVNAATTTVENLGISWVTDLLAQFKAADEVYDYHSGILLTDKISSLQDLVDRYNALGSDNQAAVLGKIIEKRNSETNGQFARSQATTDALAAALSEVEVENEVNEEEAIVEVDEAQAVEDEEVAEEAEDISEGIQE